MTCKEIMLHYHEVLPFPWTPEKIINAEHNIVDFLINFGNDLAKASDIDFYPQAQKILKSVEKLKEDNQNV